MNKQTKDSALRNCAWGYKCSKTWSELSETSDSKVRFCNNCQKEVYWVNTKAELAKSVLLNHCICFPLELIQPKKSSNQDVNLFGMGEVSSNFLYSPEEPDLK